ncbi:MAG: hypothetical protein JWP89_2799 [Schlesneria sp.]|nr:hypothetical protein [Schlesneria sp.]
MQAVNQQDLLWTFLVIAAMCGGCGTNAPSTTTSASFSPSSSPAIVNEHAAASVAIQETESEATHVWIKPYTRMDGTFVEGHWRKKTEGELKFVAKRQSKAGEPKIATAPIPYSGNPSSGSSKFKESSSEKAYEAAMSVEIVHRKDGSTYERKQRAKK